MVATYNARARAASLSTSAINAVHGDLLDKVNPSPPEFSGPEWSDFDFTTVGFAFHHFEDVVHAAKALKERLRPGGVLLLTDFLEGGDLKADEHGDPISGSEGNWAIHSHGHGHGHGHGHDHGHGHGKERDHAHHHQHHHHDHSDKKQEHEDPALKHLEEMKASMIKPHFTIDFVRSFLTEAGFVDVEVVTMKDRAYMEFAGLKLWRTILMAKGRKPDVAGERSEL
jgi:SAM-dependent methyltransferase